MSHIYRSDIFTNENDNWKMNMRFLTNTLACRVNGGWPVAPNDVPAMRRPDGGGIQNFIGNSGWLPALAVCCLTAMILGCGSNNRLATAPVSGTVTLDGKPLPYGQVVFQPLNGRIAKGSIEDGRFTLGTYEAADGAVMGRHRVSVSARKKLEGEEPGAPGVPRFGPSLIPERYDDSAASGLEFEVVSGDNIFHIELSSQR